MQFLSDLRHGFRVLLRSPGVTITALIALALAIGANTAMFSIVDAVLIRPLPFQDPDRVVMVWEDASHIGFPRNTPAPANWRDWREQNTVFTDIAATRGWAYSLTGDGSPERIPARRVSANFWSILGTAPVLGRTFTEAEDRQSAKLAVISYTLWQRRYGADPSVVGRKVLLSDEPYTVIGVMPRGFSFPHRRTEIWTPASFTPEQLGTRQSHYLQCVARLRPGVSVEQADREMKIIAKRLEQQYPGSNRNVGAAVVPIADQLTGDTSTRLIVLFVASGLVLLIACANIANLLLAKSAARSREMAVRSALGAGRGRIARQLLTESLLLAGLGAVLGVAVARLCMIALEKLVPMQMAAVSLQLDWRMLMFAAAVTVLTGVLFGLFPALTLGRLEIQESLRQGGRTAASGAHRLRDLLVISQTALALALVTCAGLMIQTLRNLQNVDLGLRTESVITMSTEVSRTRYSDHAALHAFFTKVLERVSTLPGVVTAGYTSDLPLTVTGNTSGYLVYEQSNPRPEFVGQDALFRVITPDFLQTVGATLREGRFFTKADRDTTERVAMVNETLADRHWRGQSAVGRRISIDGRNEKWLTIVGVVKEIRERGINIDTKPALYMPLAQSEGYWPTPSDLAVRTATAPGSTVSSIRQAIASVDRDQPVSEIRTMNEVVDEHLAREDQQMTLLSAFAGIALLLACTGIYGVIAYAVAQRRREIGIRMALGATPQAVLRMVFGRGFGLIACGIAAGSVLSLIGARLLSSLLYGVRPQDPWTLIASSALLAAVAMTACLIPARAATRLDPAVVLREE